LDEESILLLVKARNRADPHPTLAPGIRLGELLPFVVVGITPVVVVEVNVGGAELARHTDGVGHLPFEGPVGECARAEWQPAPGHGLDLQVAAQLTARDAGRRRWGVETA